MRHPYILILYSLILLAACSKDETEPTVIKVQLESVSGSRARFTVAPENSRAYYSYVLVSQDDSGFHNSATEICQNEIEHMETNYPYFSTGSFTDVYCYRGSRQLYVSSLSSDKDFRFIVFQINPDTHHLIGDPVDISFHTKPVPQRNLQFGIAFDGTSVTITPSDDTLSYICEYEESDLVYSLYYTATNYLYSVVGMYLEYGFLESNYSHGPVEWNFASEDNLMKDSTEYTLVVSGCEEGEFTTPPAIVKFRYHPDNIEMLERIDGNEWSMNMERRYLAVKKANVKER